MTELERYVNTALHCYCKKPTGFPQQVAVLPDLSADIAFQGWVGSVEFKFCFEMFSRTCFLKFLRTFKISEFCQNLHFANSETIVVCITAIKAICKLESGEPSTT